MKLKRSTMHDESLKIIGSSFYVLSVGYMLKTQFNKKGFYYFEILCASKS